MLVIDGSASENGPRGKWQEEHAWIPCCRKGKSSSEDWVSTYLVGFVLSMAEYSVKVCVSLHDKPQASLAEVVAGQHDAMIRLKGSAVAAGTGDND